ncbi:MAG: hypothetical protein M3O70_01060 [Actinomycetota bacterium]|nr:hypothetical protein [Actinomycetota bacterium]
MGRVVIVVRGTTKDVGALKVLMDKEIALIEESLPGTEKFEFYLDEETSRFAAHEEYPDDGALRQHIQALVASGLADEFPGVVEFDFAVALGDIRDPKVRAALEQLQFEIFPLHSKAVRQPA